MLWPVSINQLHSLRMSRYPKQVKPFEKCFIRVFNWVYSILSYFFHIWTHDNHSLFWWLAQHFGSYTIRVGRQLDMMNVLIFSRLYAFPLKSFLFSSKGLKRDMWSPATSIWPSLTSSTIKGSLLIPKLNPYSSKILL